MIDRELIVGETLWWAQRQGEGAHVVLVMINGTVSPSERFPYVSIPGRDALFCAERRNLFEHKDDAARCAVLRALSER